VLHCAMKPISHPRHRFPPDVIRHAVWLYLRFAPSYRDVEDLLAERGLIVSNVDPPLGTQIRSSDCQESEGYPAQGLRAMAFG
jgi:hypothetical protein